MTIQWMNLILLWFGFPVLLGALLYRFLWYSYPVVYSPYKELRERLGSKNITSIFSPRTLYTILKTLFLGVLLLACARPQGVDEDSRLAVEGSDMMLLLDMSGSMQLCDDLRNPQSRFEAAQREALSFIKARPYDPIGLIFFGRIALSRCPVTLDKDMLCKVLEEVKLGDIPPEGTVLASALGMAVNRLRTSTSTSKVIIMLTDGAPSEHDLPSDQVIELAKKYDIKVYTIGVGGQDGGYIFDPFGNVHPYQSPINESLLQHIAQETGGQYFRAEKPDDIARVYATIDQLEKTPTDNPLYENYYEYFPLLLWLAGLLMVIEACMRWRWIAV